MKTKNESKNAKSIKSLQSILEDPLKMRSLAKELFKLIDIDRNKYIDASELYNYMSEVSQILNCAQINLEEVKEIVSCFDMDGDQKISIEEFEIFVREIIEKMIEKEYSEISTKTRNFLSI